VRVGTHRHRRRRHLRRALPRLPLTGAAWPVRRLQARLAGATKLISTNIDALLYDSWDSVASGRRTTWEPVELPDSSRRTSSTKTPWTSTVDRRAAAAAAAAAAVVTLVWCWWYVRFCRYRFAAAGLNSKATGLVLINPPFLL
jgi:hypothetical protein